MSPFERFLEKVKEIAVLLGKIYAAFVAGDWIGIWELTKAFLALFGISI